MSARRFCVAREFSPTPGPRSPKEGPYSGEELLKKLSALLAIAIREDSHCEIDLDGTAGYATSFLEAVFGGLAREYGATEVRKRIVLISTEEPYLVDEIWGYVKDAGEVLR